MTATRSTPPVVGQFAIVAPLTPTQRVDCRLASDPSKFGRTFPQGTRVKVVSISDDFGSKFAVIDPPDGPLLRISEIELQLAP
jgi:hypothetical protein